MEIIPQYGGLLVPSEVIEHLHEELSNHNRWERANFGPPPNDTERQEIGILYHRLVTFFRRDQYRPLLFSPSFSGCGFIENSIGDVIAGITLFEIKAAGRFFRSVDLRQLLVYSALNKMCSKFEFRNIGVYNPRLGICFEISLAEICFEVSGKGADELLTDIVEAASSSGVSR